MKWLENVKEAGLAFKEWGRAMLIVCSVIAVSLVMIATELFVISVKM